jgi:hypothetical protein
MRIHNRSTAFFADSMNREKVREAEAWVRFSELENDNA